MTVQKFRPFIPFMAREPSFVRFLGRKDRDAFTPPQGVSGVVLNESIPDPRKFHDFVQGVSVAENLGVGGKIAVGLEVARAVKTTYGSNRNMGFDVVRVHLSDGSKLMVVCSSCIIALEDKIVQDQGSFRMVDTVTHLNVFALQTNLNHEGIIGVYPAQGVLVDLRSAPRKSLVFTKPLPLAAVRPSFGPEGWVYLDFSLEQDPTHCYRMTVRTPHPDSIIAFMSVVEKQVRSLFFGDFYNGLVNMASSLLGIIESK